MALKFEAVSHKWLLEEYALGFWGEVLENAAVEP